MNLPPLPVHREPPLHKRIGRITGPYAVVRQVRGLVVTLVDDAAGIVQAELFTVPLR